MSPTDLMRLIKSRRSIRKFNSSEVSDADLGQILEAGLWAPTGTNQQELRFVILAEKNDILSFARFKKIKSAKIIILIFVDFEKYYERFGAVKYLKHKKTLPFVDTGMCMMNMILMAETLGLNTVALNISDNLWCDNIRPRSIYQKILKRVSVLLGISRFGVEYFRDYLERDLKVDTKRYIPSGSVALGHSDKYLNVEGLIYKGAPVMRKMISEHLIGKSAV